MWINSKGHVNCGRQLVTHDLPNVQSTPTVSTAVKVYWYHWQTSVVQTVDTSRFIDDAVFTLECQRPQSMSGFFLFSVAAVWFHQFDVIRQRTLLHNPLFVTVIRRQLVYHLSASIISNNDQRKRAVFIRVCELLWINRQQWATEALCLPAVCPSVRPLSLHPFINIYFA